MSEETKNTEEQVVAAEVQETVIETVNPEQFLVDFNWHKY
jgi:small subunit ribosomal protein S1